MKKLLLVLFFLTFHNLTFADPKMDLGLEVYNDKAQCGICHTLQAAGSIGNIGPNLDQLKPLKDQVIASVTNGIGVMPAFEDTLTQEEIEAVSHYVFNSTNK
mgnify:CR=1 FL=1